jgi:hypothetical protein
MMSNYPNRILSYKGYEIGISTGGNVHFDLVILSHTKKLFTVTAFHTDNKILSTAFDFVLCMLQFYV